MLLSKRNAVLFLALLSLQGCSKVQDMHDATMAMEKKTGALSATSDEMKAIMGEILDSGRQGAALDVRYKNFQAMLDSEKLEDKGLYSGLYFLGFEFQLWSKLGNDNSPGARDRVMKDAADEFFRRMNGISNFEGVDPFAGKNPVKGVFMSKSESDKASFNALASTLERNNRKQEAIAARDGEQPISMLAMIETALRAGKEIQAGNKSIRDYPEYVEVILTRREIAIHLLEARYQMMGVTVLALLTPITENFTQGFLYKIWGTHWDIDLKSEKMNVAKLRLATFRFKEALAAKEVLSEIGVEVTLDPSISKIFKNATLKNAPGTLEGDTSATAELKKYNADFVLALEEYTGKQAN